jgi:hypothetical protein
MAYFSSFKPIPSFRRIRLAWTVWR